MIQSSKVSFSHKKRSDLPFGFRLARVAFLQSRFRRKPVGCAYVEGARAILASNDTKTSPLAASLGSRKCRIHAEVAVLKQLKNAPGDLYIYRERKNGSLGMARPCSSCMVLIKQKGVKRIFYTTYSGFSKEKICINTL